MAELSPYAMVHSVDQWRRIAHDHTALEKNGEDHAIAQLAWISDDDVASSSLVIAAEEEPMLPAGMAFDPWCRLYRSRPELGQVEKTLWAAEGDSTEAQPLFSTSNNSLGEFSGQSEASSIGPLQRPVDVVVDNQGRLFVAEQGAKRVLVFHLIEAQLLRYIYFENAPLKLASDGTQVWALFSGTSEVALASFDARSKPRYQKLPEGIIAPTDLVIADDEVYILDQGGTEGAQIVPVNTPDDAFLIPYAQAIKLLDNKVLVVARRVSEDFLRFELEPGAQTELPHLKARHYDGRGIVVTPDGDVAYWSKNGLLRATLARVRYETEGSLTSFQLDSGNFQTQWGRLFIDACIPRGTSVTARCLVLDEVPETATAMAHTPPENMIGLTINQPHLTLLPPAILIANVTHKHTFHQRRHGKEIPWQGCDDEHFHTYETPIVAPPGRYLWVVLELSGTSRKTPRLKSMRAEYPSHDLLYRLPKVYSRDPGLADFLRRFLAMPEGQLRDLDLQATYRHALLDPYATPPELLPWLASFMGLIIDHRWPEVAKRELVAQCTWLFRYRGTVMGVKRFLEIYLNSTVQIIEHFKVRGLGGAFVGGSGKNNKGDALTSSAVLGAGFRIGGSLGSLKVESINDVAIQDAIELHAHRFSIIIAASLSAEQLQVVRLILDTHRPAHTLYDLCTVDAGMRIGLGLHLGLTSIIGNPSGFGQLQLGAYLLGRSDTLGQARAGTVIGSSRLGDDSRVG